MQKQLKFIAKIYSYVNHYPQNYFKCLQRKNIYFI